tara:strand:- start:228 stop:641 length:414 start_codon:yes stop_codon:yes gene_type:complete
MSALDKLRRRFIESGELAPTDVADLLNIATAAEMSAMKSAAQLSESRRQVSALMTERETARDIVAQAQTVVMQSLSALIVDLTTADRDVYISVLAGAGVEITHQARDAADRSDEHTYCGQTIGEAVALCRADMQEST